MVTACSLAITGQELLLQPVASPPHGLQGVWGVGRPRVGVLSTSKVKEGGQRRASVLLAIGRQPRGGAGGARASLFIAFFVAGDLGDVASIAGNHRFTQHGIIVHLFVGLVSETKDLLGLLSSLGG